MKNWRKVFAKSESFKDKFKRFKTENKQELINRAEFTGDKFPKSGDSSKKEIDAWKAGDKLSKKDRNIESKSNGSAVVNEKAKRENFKSQKTSDWRDSLIKTSDVNFKQKQDGEVNISVTTPQPAALETPIDETLENDEVGETLPTDDKKDARFFNEEELREWAKKSNLNWQNAGNIKNRLFDKISYVIDKSTASEFCNDLPANATLTDAYNLLRKWDDAKQVSSEIRWKISVILSNMDKDDTAFSRGHLNWNLTSDHQTLMDEAYDLWKNNDTWNREEFLENLQSKAHKDAVVLGNLNYQVGNGGFAQWYDNQYGVRDARYLITELLPAIGTQNSLKVLSLVKNATRIYRNITQINNHNENETALEHLYDQFDSLDTEYYAIDDAFMKDVQQYLTNLVNNGVNLSWRNVLAASEPDVQFKRKPDGTFELNVTHPQPEPDLPVLDTTPPDNTQQAQSLQPTSSKNQKQKNDDDDEEKWQVIKKQVMEEFGYDDIDDENEDEINRVTDERFEKKYKREKYASCKETITNEWIIKEAVKNNKTYQLIGRECDKFCGVFIEKKVTGVLSKAASKISKNNIIDFEKVDKIGDNWRENINEAVWISKFDEFINAK